MSEELSKLSNDSLMSLVAKGTYNEDDFKSLTEENKTKQQIKLFTLVRVKRELERVIKYNELLTNLENKFDSMVNDAMQKDMLPLEAYVTLIQTVNGILDRSDKIIQRVLNDDTLNNIFIIDNSKNVTNNNTLLNANSVMGLSDPESRERVNKAVNSVLSMISNIELQQEDSEDVIVTNDEDIQEDE